MKRIALLAAQSLVWVASDKLRRLDRRIRFALIEHPGDRIDWSGWRE